MTVRPGVDSDPMSDRVRELGIAFVGFGRAARTWQAPMYARHGLRVVGAYDTAPDATAALAATHPEATRFESLKSLLADSRVDVVDLATRPPGRLELLERIIDAGKHVLVQKPVSADVAGVTAVVRQAEAAGSRVAVNVNGRWAPAWNRATALIDQGALGTIQSITHVFDTRLAWLPRPEIQGTDQFLLFDYTTHWADITQRWAWGHAIAAVQAQVQPAPVQPETGERLETMWVSIQFTDGPSALIRGAAAGIARNAHPFWVHGCEGTLRGSVDTITGDWLELETRTGLRSIALEGAWFPDAFAGPMVELLHAVVEAREPSNSLRDHLRAVACSVAACESANAGCTPVRDPLEHYGAME